MPTGNELAVLAVLALIIGVVLGALAAQILNRPVSRTIGLLDPDADYSSEKIKSFRDGGLV
jgi:uncharacterized membrane-anchored protein YhcB (DUF1043 family)